MTQDIHTDTAIQPSTLLPSPNKKLRPSRKTTPFSWFDDPFNPVHGERSLWMAVITQAMMDALSKSSNKEAQYHKHEAIRWLSENSKDFIEVCLNAGFRPDEVRRKAKKALLNPSLWRAEAGKGKRYTERKIYRQKRKTLLQAQRIQHPQPRELNSQIIMGPWA